jgi:hypothetical protein
MSSTEQFFGSLLHQKGVLGSSPFLDANSQRGLESSYCLLHDIIKHTGSRQTQNRHDKARQHLKNIYSIAKPLFVLVAVTISITDLASLDHNEIFPRLENWWQNNESSQKFQSRAIELIQELDHEKERGGLKHVQRKSFPSLVQCTDTVLTLLKERTKSRTFGRSRGVKHKRVKHPVSTREPTPQSPIDQPTELPDALLGFGDALPFFALLRSY